MGRLFGYGIAVHEIGACICSALAVLIIDKPVAVFQYGIQIHAVNQSGRVAVVEYRIEWGNSGILSRHWLPTA